MTWHVCVGVGVGVGVGVHQGCKFLQHLWTRQSCVPWNSDAWNYVCV